MATKNKIVGFARLGPHQLLNRLLKNPDLVTAVQALKPGALIKLVDHIGLEDSGELVSLATTEQLVQIFDTDLWHGARPGVEESFDADRFVIWLEVMIEAGEDFVASRLTELPEDLVTLALSRQILVINIDDLAREMIGRDENGRHEDVDLTDKALESCLYHEFDEYHIISKKHHGWDAILSVLLALDKNHPEFLERLLRRCCHISSEYIVENGGLYNVLTSEEMLEQDIAGERDDRRAREGFIAPTQAANFLKLARLTSLQEISESRTSDSITHAYFRDLESVVINEAASVKTTVVASRATSMSDFVALLEEEDLIEQWQPTPLLHGKQAPQADPPDAQFRQAILTLYERDLDTHSLRLAELAYLANVLTAGTSLFDRRFRPSEAAEAAVAISNLGLEHLIDKTSGNEARLTSQAVDLLTAESAHKLFRLGWHLLYKEVCLATAQALERMLSHWITEAGADHVEKVIMALKAARRAGEPWIVRYHLETLDVFFDPSELATLKALLDECPLLVGAICTHRTNDRQWEFIASSKQIQKVRRFLKELEIWHEKEG